MIPGVPEAWKTASIKEGPDREDWERVRPKGSGPTLCEEHGISMSDVLALPSDARKVADGYLIKHPIHGATGDGNLFVNFDKNLWCCFRHDVGGDPLTWVAVREGFINCEDAGPLDKDTALRCKDVLRRDGFIPDDRTPSTEVAAKCTHGCTEGAGLIDRGPFTWYCGDLNRAAVQLNGKTVYKSMPEIVPVMVVDGPKTINALLDVFHEHLYFEENYNITGPVCAFLCNFTSQDPGIMGLIGPSGSIKTEMIRTFGEVENQFCYPISSITEHTLVSGLDKNIDTIPLLRGRVLTIKDLTTLLSKNEDIRSAIFADFREVTDGYIKKEFGSGVKKAYNDIHSSILFASTPAIEGYFSMFAELGTRMLFMRPQNDPIKARQKSRENQKAGMQPIRKALNEAMLSFIDTSVSRLINEQLPEIPADLEEEIGQFCDVLAWLRHPLHHDRLGFITENNPDPEFPTRLSNSICLMTQMHAFIHERSVVDREHDYEFARRLVADNVPTNRAAVITHLTDDLQSTSKLSEVSGIPARSISRVLDDLTVLKLAKKLGQESARDAGLDGRSNQYKLTPEWSQSIRRLNNAIRLGGRVRKNIRDISQEEQESNALIPDRIVQLVQPSGDHAELMRVVRDTLIAWRDADGSNQTKKVNRKHFVNEVAAVLRVRHPQWAGRPIEEDIAHLNESDPEIQSLLAELTTA